MKLKPWHKRKPVCRTPALLCKFGKTWWKRVDGLTGLQQNVLPNQGHAQPQIAELRNAEGLMTLPQKQPLVPTRQSLPPTKGMVQEIRLICFLILFLQKKIFKIFCA